MALHAPPSGSIEATRNRIVELVGTGSGARRPAAEPEDTPVVLALQLQAIDNFVEMIRLRTELADRDRRIATLRLGLRTWRERAGLELVGRRGDATEAREREREIISLLHQQMQVADAATAELERIRALPWWRRFRG
jgi:tetrahydromethanopterin S-methyltransferase subunit F